MLGQITQKYVCMWIFSFWDVAPIHIPESGLGPRLQRCGHCGEAKAEHESKTIYLLFSRVNRCLSPVMDRQTDGLTLGCGGTRNSHHGCAVNISAPTV